MNWTSLRRITDSADASPSVEPVTLAEFKTHAKIDIDNEDGYHTAMLVAARKYCEDWTGRAFLTQVWQMTIDDFPSVDTTEILLPVPPLQTVSSITYKDGSDVTQTLSTDVYDVDAPAGAIRLAYNQEWPIVRNVRGAVTITFVAGYGDAASNVPDGIKHAIKMLTSHWHEHREPVVIGSGINQHQLPMVVEALLSQYNARGFPA